MSDFNWVDKVFLVVFIISALMGLLRGGVREIFSLLSWIAGLVVAAVFAHPLATYLNHFSFFQSMGPSTSDGSSASMLTLGISSLILFFGTVLIGGLLGRVANAVIEGAGISLFNRLFGVIFGFGRAYVMGLLVIFVVQLTSIAEEDYWKESRVVHAYQPAVKWFGNIVQPKLDSLKNKMQPEINNLKSSIQGASQDTSSNPQTE